MAKEKTNTEIAMHVSAVTIICNILLAVFKFIAGLISQSGAMLSDAVHSLSDVLSTFIVMIGVKIAEKESDLDHPYGHERFECVAAILLAVFLALVGAGIGWNGLQKIIYQSQDTMTIPGQLALIAAVVSVVIKEIMFWYTMHAAKMISSGALQADAWHHRSDALSSIGSFIGILGARMGYPILDPLACVIICGFIFKAAYDVFMDAIDKMTDHSCDKETIDMLWKVISTQDGVIAVDLVKTRMFGDKVYVDIEIQADGEISLYEAHEIAEHVHDTVECYLPKIKHCMIHVNPAQFHKAEGKGCHDILL